MNRTTLSEFKKKAFTDFSVKAEYDALSPAYNFRQKLIALRQKANLTQEQIANSNNVEYSKK